MKRTGAAIVLTCLGVFCLGCGDDPELLSPETKARVSGRLLGDLAQEEQLDFVALSATAPPLETTDTSFWAVAGQERELRISYLSAESNGDEHETFLKLEIDEETLWRWPDGSWFDEGDSVKIRVVVEPGQFLATYFPAGLQFDPDSPAELTLYYDQADADFLALESEFDIWRQEQAGEPWMRLGGVRVAASAVIKARLEGFTRYALAVGR